MEQAMNAKAINFWRKGTIAEVKRKIAGWLHIYRHMQNPQPPKDEWAAALESEQRLAQPRRGIVKALRDAIKADWGPQ